MANSDTNDEVPADGDEVPADGKDEVADDELRPVADAPPDLSAWDRAFQKRLEQDRLRPDFHPVDVDEQPVRFTVRDVLLLTAFAAVLFALFRVVRPDLFALTLGVVAFVSLVVLSVVRQSKSILHVGWWVLLLVYLVTAIVTAFR